MISQAQFNTEIELIITNAIREDVGDGDHSSLACIPDTAHGKAKLLVKDEGIIAPPTDDKGGVVEAPKDDEDKIFQKVEIDAEFPGGVATPPTITSPTSPSAWQEIMWMVVSFFIGIN